ncbi:MAG: hypothetical protein RLZZ76_710 [Candidatus Parcubacteria bacterium]
MTAIQVMGQLPDTGTPVHLLIESGTAKELDLLPTKNAKKFKPTVLSDIVDHTQAIGIKFVGKPDLKQLLSGDFIGEIGSAKNPDTVAYIGTMQAVAGDDDVGDGELVILAIGKQARDIIDAFSELGDHKVMDTTLVKQYFINVVTGNSATTSGPKDMKPTRQLAEA